MTATASPERGDRPAPGHDPPTTGSTMHARVGDEIVVRGTTAGVISRDGEIVGLHHRDGTPPYDIRWAEDGRVTLYFPGSDAFVRHLTHAHEPPSGGDHDHAR
ncbi:DUF1918 domain-containing protein [Streptomyces sp. NPDC001606]